MKLPIAIAAAALALAWSCAHVEAPPGGGEDEVPPALLATRPDTLSVVPAWDAPAVLVFDERISERGLEEAVVVSPRTSMVVVDHRGDEVRVRLRGGWEPGRIYHVTLLPQVQDLFNNRLTGPATLVFSTGPEIPSTAIAGIVRDPLTGKPESGVRVEAVRTEDSLVYSLPTDSAGEYRIQRVPEGAYQLRAFRDINRNRALDPFEPRGVAAVTVIAGDSIRQALGVLMPDSTPPQLAAAELRDTLTVELRFDDYLDPTQNLDQRNVQIFTPEGTPITLNAITVGTPPDSASAGRPRAGQPADTATAEVLPSQTLQVRLAPDARLQPDTTYTVRVTNIRNVVGLSADGEAELKTPEAPARRAPAPPDSLVPPDSMVLPDSTALPDSIARPDTAQLRISERRRRGTPEP